MGEKVRMSGPTLKVLKVLLESAREAKSGAEISKTTGLGSGTVYPVLQRLEAARWIAGGWEDVNPSAVGRPKRKLYRLTPSGRASALKEFASYQTPAVGKLIWT
ncbi:PadR family transcriptional regulator [Bradyrhizobium sp. SZCCHNR2026]|uniref:PadR family transcriptional regulator n=1 Tax=Bradyrhizobium sp. SZCCHNR2026 TaxID=3057381 RepID=UPI002916DC2B|nr:PadR family transcriptional regulator [Bradyrhizobium sp. SZCCHNR2026]